MVTFLGKALPIGIGLMAAVLVIVPLSPRGEISFLLDRNKVAVTNERLQVSTAAYKGVDNASRPFLLTAGSAVQQSASVPIVRLQDLTAQLNMKDGPAQIKAPSGAYDYRAEKMAIDGPVNFAAADGYRMETNNVAIDIKSKNAVGSGGVTGSVPTGTFQANSIVANLEDRTVTLDGNARLRMTPGKLRIPQ